MTITYDKFVELAGNIINVIPKKFLRNLNGGFSIIPKLKKDDDFYVMGEYIEDYLMGNYIVIYFGSFKEILKNKSIKEWEIELKDTIWHELQHHIESLAGVDYLGQIDEETKRRMETE